MAESMFRFKADRRGVGDRVAVSSAATHSDELGNPPHRGTRAKLAEHGIPLVPHRARLLCRSDGELYDHIIGMDRENLAAMRRILGEKYAEKVSLLLDFTSAPRDVADPWYTGDFDAAFDDISRGIDGFLRFLQERKEL